MLAESKQKEFVEEVVGDLQELSKNVRSAHFRLVWLVGGSTVERSALLRRFADAESIPCLDVGRELSSALIELPASFRPASVEDCFSAMLDDQRETTICLDHLEILFEPSLRLQPVELVRNASRHHTLIASWPGVDEGNALVFGSADHPAHQRMPKLMLESPVFEFKP